MTPNNKLEKLKEYIRAHHIGIIIIASLCFILAFISMLIYTL